MARWMDSERQALGQVTLAYVWWGSSAIFWSQLASVSPVDQVAFRVATAFIYLVAGGVLFRRQLTTRGIDCLLYTSDAADE